MIDWILSSLTTNSAVFRPTHSAIVLRTIVYDCPYLGPHNVPLGITYQQFITLVDSFPGSKTVDIGDHSWIH